MASDTENYFRFLDLPPELRCCVYEQIEFPTTWHFLDRIVANFSKRDWPVPPKEQVYDSRVTLIRPHTECAIEVLLTCHLISQEARSILKRRVEHIRTQPVRFLVDYSAAWALFGYGGPLNPCIGVDSDFLLRYYSLPASLFIQSCRSALSQSRQRPDGTRGPRSIELTIEHKTGVVYGRELLMTLAVIPDFDDQFDSPTRLVVVYKSPLPELQLDGTTKTVGNYKTEEAMLQHVPRESGPGDVATGVFVRSLKEDAFEKHLESLDIY